MYICLKTTENTDKILEAFKERDIELTVRKGKALTFIEADETEMNKFVGFVAIYSQTLVLSSLNNFLLSSATTYPRPSPTVISMLSFPPSTTVAIT